jgi:hypothetical protein
MATDRRVRAALLKKLGNISPQALSQRVKRVKGRIPISTEDAVYVLAHENGIDISRSLDRETVSRVAGYVSQLKTPVAGSPREAKRTPKPPQAREVVIRGIRIEGLPALSAKHAAEAKRMAEKAYPMLYVFENSARDVITRVLEAAFGSDWWNQVVPKKVRDKAEGRIGQEGDDAWHSVRGAHPINYVDLRDLATIVNSSKPWPKFGGTVFPPRQNWFEGIIDDMNVSRRVIAHMNPLSADDIKQIEAGFAKWSRQIKSKSSAIP